MGEGDLCQCDGPTTRTKIFQTANVCPICNKPYTNTDRYEQIKKEMGPKTRPRDTDSGDLEDMGERNQNNVGTQDSVDSARRVEINDDYRQNEAHQNTERTQQERRSLRGSMTGLEENIGNHFGIARGRRDLYSPNRSENDSINENDQGRHHLPGLISVPERAGSKCKLDPPKYAGDKGPVKHFL